MLDRPSVLNTVSTTIVSLHKQVFGRGPSRARTNWAGDDLLVCTLEDALLPAEVDMVQMGAGHRVAEQRLFLQAATESRFVEAVEAVVGREVAVFTSATDPGSRTVFDIFKFAPASSTA